MDRVIPNLQLPTPKTFQPRRTRRTRRHLSRVKTCRPRVSDTGGAIYPERSPTCRARLRRGRRTRLSHELRVRRRQAVAVPADDANANRVEKLLTTRHPLF